MHVCPMVLAIWVAEQAGIKMMKEYFKIEASKSTPQYRFRKGQNYSVMKVIRLPKKSSRQTYLEEDALTCYLGRTLHRILENKH